MKYCKHSASGNIKAINDSSIVFRTNSEEITKEYKDGTYSTTNTDFVQMYKPIVKEYLQNIPIKNINFTNCRSAARDNIAILGGYLIVGSLLTLVASPLVSIDYLHGGFNSTRFRQVALAGGIGLSVGIPLSVIGRSKKRNITSKNTKRDKDYWYLESL